MNNWELLKDDECITCWEYISNKLLFKPYNMVNNISFSQQNKCFDISKFYNDGYSEYMYEDLHTKALLWFRDISTSNRMYALNWQHDCYSFLPDLPFEIDSFGEWLIPIFPNGDYLFFLTNDFSNGIFADGINCRLSFWGLDIIKALETNMPHMLR